MLLAPHTGIIRKWTSRAPHGGNSASPTPTPHVGIFRKANQEYHRRIDSITHSLVIAAE
jgi:hypothetical protein